MCRPRACPHVTQSSRPSTELLVGRNGKVRDVRHHVGTALALVCALILLGARPAAARTWYIQAGGGGDAPTIQAGIDSSMSGDSVVVATGFYDENLDMRSKSIVLHGNSGPDVTVIDIPPRAGSRSELHHPEQRCGLRSKRRYGGWDLHGGTNGGRELRGAG